MTDYILIIKGKAGRHTSPAFLLVRSHAKIAIETAIHGRGSTIMLKLMDTLYM